MADDKYILWYTYLRYWVLTTTNKKVSEYIDFFNYEITGLYQKNISLYSLGKKGANTTLKWTY